jgi:hypothetical protein
MERYLIIVSQDRPELCQELRSTYSHSGEVEVLLDRRQALRQTCPGNDADRRSAVRLGTGVEGQGFFVIPRL